MGKELSIKEKWNNEIYNLTATNTPSGMGTQYFGGGLGFFDYANMLTSGVTSVAQGVTNAAGAVGGMPCWVAREVYGEDNPRWIRFRHWLLESAPKWFVRLYMKHGERFALFISDKPRVKRLIRSWMDSKIDTRLIEECI
tara:strand:- start:601 stop:1020 length:420 start_codon:yes stop_codon:yes gene_type:complete